MVYGMLDSVVSAFDEELSSYNLRGRSRVFVMLAPVEG